MAYQFEDKEDENQQGQPEQQLGAESAIVSNAPKQATAQAEGSGTYTNLQNYLEANQGANQGQKFASKLGETITGAELGQQEAEQGFKQNVDSSAIVGDSALVKKAVERPEEVISNEDEATKFKRIRDAQYKGPENLVGDVGNYQKAYGTTQKAKEEADLAGEESGRFALLDKYWGGGAGRYDYTKGQRKLDQLLLQNDPNSRDAIAAQQGRAKNVQDQYAQLNDRLSQYAQGRKQQTQAARSEARQALGIDDAGSEGQFGAIYQTKGDIQRRAREAESARNRITSDITGQFSQRDITPEIAQRLGLQEGMRIYNVDPNQYYRGGMTPTLANVASEADYNRINSLYGLADLENSFLTDKSQLGAYDPNKAFDFSTDRFLNDVKAQEARYNELLNQKIFQQGQGVGANGAQFGGGVSNRYLGTPEDSEYGFASKISDPFVQGSLQDQINYYQNYLQPLYTSNRAQIPGSQQATYQQLQDALNELQRRKGYGNILR